MQRTSLSATKNNASNIATVSAASNFITSTPLLLQAKSYPALLCSPTDPTKSVRLGSGNPRRSSGAVADLTRSNDRSEMLNSTELIITFESLNHRPLACYSQPVRWNVFIYVSWRTVACEGIWHLFRSGAVVLLISTQLLRSQSPTVVESPTPTLHVNTQIVLLDVAVIDKRGHQTNSILKREDFAITEDGKPQRLLSFEPPLSHSTATTTIFVLDELNTSAADKGYYLVCFEQYLRSLPETLSVPVELVVLTASSIQIAQTSTRSRAELLSTLIHLPTSDVTLANLELERFSKTLSALQSIALESLGESGRTAVVWLGPGDGIDVNSQPAAKRPQTERFVRYMTNTLLESRITLYVIFPPDFVGASSPFRKSSESREVSIANLYDGGINFRTLATETGGAVYTATNDLTGAMRDALALGRGSYTLGYRPDNTEMDGRFRQIWVSLRNSALHIVNTSGYYVPELQEQNAPQTIQVFQMTEAGKSTLPFRGLQLRVTHFDRSPDAKSAEFTLLAEAKDLSWRSESPGESLAELTAGGLSLSKQGKKLSSSFRNVTMMARSQDPVVLRETAVSFKLTLALPSETDRVRLVVSSRANGKLGCVDVPRAVLDAAATTATNLAPER